MPFVRRCSDGTFTKVKLSNTNKIDLKSKIFLRLSSREEIGFKVKVYTSANKNNNNRNLPAVNIPGLIVNSNKMGLQQQKVTIVDSENIKVVG